LVAEAEENNLDLKVKRARWARWSTCGLCEQEYHGIVCCALGLACWKTYVGRPEADTARKLAMSVLAGGLLEANLYEDALSVQEARLSLMRRIGASEHNLLIIQGNLAVTYSKLGRLGEANRMLRDVYSGRLKLDGEEHVATLREASNYAISLSHLQRFGEAKSLLRKSMPVARRVLGENNDLTIRLRQTYAKSLYEDDAATLNDLREAVTMLVETARTARRVLGGAHPLVLDMERKLRDARAVLRAREA
jgi:hypothetical protein